MNTRLRIASVSVALITVLAAARPSIASARALSFDERVAAQKAIEQVYWNHRIWPKENPGPKPLLSEVLPDEAIRARVEDDLKKSNALATWWQRPVTPEQLQAELDRIGKETRDERTLQELFRALGRDPHLIAETLGRHTLVDRLIRSWYGADARFQGGLRESAEAARAACANVDCMKAMGGEYHETTWALRDEPLVAGGRDHEIRMDAGDWKNHLQGLATEFGATAEPLPIGPLTGVAETQEAFVVTAVLTQRPGELVTASVAWPKRSFDSWWSTESIKTSPTIPKLTGTYTLADTTSAGCVNDTWRSQAYAPATRFSHTAVWTGAEMIVWGGYDGSNYLRTGARYDPTTDAWTATSTGSNVPSGRAQHTAVWTGTEMIVWGGQNGSNPNTGGRYNPATDSWTATSTGANVPSYRYAHTAVWTGTEMIVWGGTGSSSTNSGGRYTPSTDSWVATALPAPAPRSGHTAAWTGTEMIVWGGYSGTWLNTGGRYTPGTDAWSLTSTGANVPSVRYWHTVVWTGTEMIVWGGYGGSWLNTGGRYTPATDSWASTSTGANVPSLRYVHTAVWTDGAMVIWGGSTGGFNFLNTGGRYEPSTNAWSKTSTGENVATPRQFHTAAWTGTEMIVLGGDPLASNVGFYCTCASPVVAYRDLDGDGFGDAGVSASTCGGSPPAGFVADDTDCNDSNASIHPGAPETCNGLDDNCDVVVDNEEAAACSDGNACTIGDACTNGSCVGTFGADASDVEPVWAFKSNLTATFEWNAPAGAIAYDVLRGRIGDWPVGSNPATESCLAPDAFATTYDDATAPPFGEGYWYLVRADYACGNGSYGSQSSHGVATVPRLSSTCP